MNNDSPQKALLVVFLVALVCSLLVSSVSVLLRPIQQRNKLVEQSKNVVALAGVPEDGAGASGQAILDAVEQLDIRVIDIDSGDFATDINAAELDARADASELSIAIPPQYDLAGLTRRSSYAVIYLVWDHEELSRIIFPIAGQGMWSTIRGYLALENDLNTIAAVSFYEQTETAGLGDQIEQSDWQAQWRGRRLFDRQGNFRFRVGPGIVSPESPQSEHQVDALAGATVTGDAVTRMIAYWFGPHGYKPFLDTLKTRPPLKAGNPSDAGDRAP